MNEIIKTESKEIVISYNFNKDHLEEIKKNIRVTISYQDDALEDKKVKDICSNISDLRQIKAVNRLFQYLLRTQKRSLDYIKKAEIIENNQYLQIDNFSSNNLEILKTSRTEDRYGSLLWLLDKCKTAMGSRMLIKWLKNPLYVYEKIEERLKIVDGFTNSFLTRKDVINNLKEVYDLERLVAKISYGSANAKDLIQLKKSLQVMPFIKNSLKNSGEMDLFVLSTKMEIFDNLVKIIDDSIVENPPLSIKDGDLIKKNYSKQLDELKEMSHDGKKFIAKIESDDREKTGIKNLKIGYNRVFGYYIEITKSYQNLVKEEFGYIRKQTLANAERYITSELKEVEEKVLRAEEQSIKLEYELFTQIRDQIKDYTSKIQKLADIISYIEVLSNFSEISIPNKY